MKYFKPEEFACPCGRPECDAPKAIHPALAVKLDSIRELYARPMYVTSGIRCRAHNLAVGGEANSEHLTGEGVDISCETSSGRFWLKKAAYAIGIRRLGRYPRHIHIGVSSTLPQDVEW